VTFAIDQEISTTVVGDLTERWIDTCTSCEDFELDATRVCWEDLSVASVPFTCEQVGAVSGSWIDAYVSGQHFKIDATQVEWEIVHLDNETSPHEQVNGSLSQNWVANSEIYFASGAKMPPEKKVTKASYFVGNSESHFASGAKMPPEIKVTKASYFHKKQNQSPLAFIAVLVLALFGLSATVANGELNADARNQVSPFQGWAYCESLVNDRAHECFHDIMVAQMEEHADEKMSMAAENDRLQSLLQSRYPALRPSIEPENLLNQRNLELDRCESLVKVQMDENAALVANLRSLAQSCGRQHPEVLSDNLGNASRLAALQQESDATAEKLDPSQIRYQSVEMPVS
jgi:hypothetical protein